MKTTLFTIITALVLAGGIAGTTYASTNNNNNAATVLTDVSKINKIEIRGNVELYVTAGNADQVKVYNRYYAESALVQSQNGVLRITSYKAEKLVVWVTANDLRAISAFDNAQVKSFGKFSAIDLEVNLHNNATAQLNLDTYYANVNVSDHAKIDLAGTASVYNLNHTAATSVNNNNFTAVTYNDNFINGAAKGMIVNELAVL
ncbi:GIN domain-containing protein [Mucilaginibacter pocheonensis]|uniref:Putative auto-transporter adhesin head GIN domain-containing protein n=1 Tax=Mucilaginibacter pocheonensis TaxID=398050 RepID=A0ABU1TGW5_9SPHI|nr:DUF2807 domain-containing protein [Mucilaginibacter pocheonensis]MDR6944494.1 hypothetical protein [Mucilaginibacter pocheonensis]